MREETPPRPRGRGGAALRAAAGVAGAHGGWRRASPGAGGSKSQPAPRGRGYRPPFGMRRAAAASPAPVEAAWPAARAANSDSDRVHMKTQTTDSDRVHMKTLTKNERPGE